MGPDYLLPAKYRYEDGLTKYNEFFYHCSEDRLRVEATAEYLYSRNTPGNIKESLPNVKLMFILRNPVSRLISWYKFARQIGKLNPEMSFDEYVGSQISVSNNTEQHMKALSEGCYSRFLASYFDLFGRDKIHVIFFEDLAVRPIDVMTDLSGFAGIQPDFYKNYAFHVYNKTQEMKYSQLHQAYVQLRFHVRKFTHNRISAHSMLRRLKLIFEPLYLRLNKGESQDTSMSVSTQNVLDEYYRQEIDALENLIGKKVPWRMTG